MKTIRQWYIEGIVLYFIFLSFTYSASHMSAFCSGIIFQIVGKGLSILNFGMGVFVISAMYNAYKEDFK